MADWCGSDHRREVAMAIPAAAWSSKNQPDIPPPCAAIQLVKALPWLSKSPPPTATGTAMTIEEWDVDRAVQWLVSITMLSSVIAAVSNDGDRRLHRRRRRRRHHAPVVAAEPHAPVRVYMAAAVLARGHLMLFLPRAPLVVSDALPYAGNFIAIGMAVAVSSTAVLLLFHHLLPCVVIAWFCIVAALVAAVGAFWLCLVRTYSSCGDSSDWLLEITQRST